jgi:hypothetical protein
VRCATLRASAHDHCFRRVALGSSRGLGQCRGNNEPAAIFHECMSHEVSLASLPCPCDKAWPPGPWSRHASRWRSSRHEVALAVAARAERIARTILRLEALHRGPGSNLRAIDRKMLVRQQPVQAHVVHEFGQKFPCDVSLKQPSRFFVNTVGTQTGSSTASPTNQR